MRTPAVAFLLVVACTLGACGKSDVAIVTRPVVPIWVCKNDRHERPRREAAKAASTPGA